MAQEKYTEPTKSVAESFKEILEDEPKLVTNYVPEKQSAISQKSAFLAGEIRNPDHVYDKLDAIDFDQAARHIQQVGDDILKNPNLDPKHRQVYEQFVTGYLSKTHLMELARDYKHETDADKKAAIKEAYMDLNIELYGKPDEATYRSLLQEKLDRIDQKQLSGNALTIRDELAGILDYTPSSEKRERFAPSSDTVEWMHTVAESLYGGMLNHVPDNETFSPEEVQTIFSEIIEQEFGEAAAEWHVDIEPAKSINVKTAEKRIVIPEDRATISQAALKGLVVHEIGVHMLRSVNGYETDLMPLATGLNDYYDSEEGLGVVMEQALSGKFKESGTEPYLTAGLAYYDKKDFRDTFEAKWRLTVLASATPDTEITEEAIAKAKNTAYSSVMRSMRGTDELPWFKDLAYYNGVMAVWQHLESIKGDDLKFTFVLMGKADSANKEHERILLETRTV